MKTAFSFLVPSLFFKILLQGKNLHFVDAVHYLLPPPPVTKHDGYSFEFAGCSSDHVKT